MAIHIETELREANKTIYAIWCMAQEALRQAYKEETAPYWAVTIDLLSRQAQTEMEALHNRLASQIEG